MKDVKLAFQLLKYSFDLKSNLILMVVFALVGIVEFIAGEDMSFLGGYFFVLLWMFPMQMLAGIGYANLVAASPQKKRLLTNSTAGLCTVGTLIGYAVSLLLAWGIANLCGYMTADLLKKDIITFAFLVFMLIIYMAFVYRYFIISIVAFLVCFFTLFVFNGAFTSSGVEIELINRLPLGVCIVLGIIIIAISNFVFFLSQKALYRVPLSNRSMGAKMRSKMM